MLMPLDAPREPGPPSVLVVDDDDDIRSLVSDVLVGAGFAVASAQDGAEMWSRLDATAVDLVVLDLNLKHDDGLGLCRELRATSPVPIIMLTARADPIDRIVGLELGADDYVTKPFEPRELVARIRTVLRRIVKAPGPAAQRVTMASFDNWTLDFEQRHLIDPDGLLVMLSGVEFTLLKALVENAQSVLTRERMLGICYGRDIGERAIDLQVSRLRHKLRDEMRASSLIKTVRGEGYVFAARVDLR